MTTALDTNVLVAVLMDAADAFPQMAEALAEARSRGPLVISAPVYCELLAAPSRKTDLIDNFLHDATIEVDWGMSQVVWLEAARAFRQYTARRRAQGDPGPRRRILADFLIGAHALIQADALITLDKRLYRAAFPKLRIVEV